MSGAAGKERPRPLGRKRLAGQWRRGPECVGGKTCKRKRVARETRQRAENAVLQIPPPAADRSQQAAVGLGVVPETGSRLLERALHENRGAVVEGMGHRRRRVDQVEAVLGQGERAKEGRPRDERMTGGADVVDEAGQSQLRGADAPSERVLGFAYGHPPPRFRKRDRGRETVRPRADYDGVVAVAQLTSARTDDRASRTISRAITSRWISFVPS